MGVCSSRRNGEEVVGAMHSIRSFRSMKLLPSQIRRQRSLVLELEEEETNSWKAIHQTGQIPCERSGHGVVLVNKTVFLFGGYGGIDPIHLSDLHCFDMEQRRWSRVRDSGTVPCPRTAFAMCWDQRSSIFLMGGTDHDLQGLADQEVYEYSINSRQWQRMPTLNRGILELRYFGRSANCYYNSILFFGGGVKGGRFTNELLKLDLETRRWDRLETFGQLPCARYKHQTLLLEDKLCIIGGGCYLPPQEEIDVYILCLKTLEWTYIQTTGDIPEGRAAHTCEYDAQENAAYCWGGFNKSLVPLQDLYKLDLNTYTWTLLSTKQNKDVPPCRSFHASCFYQGALYSFNGSDGEKRYDDILRYQIRRSPAPLTTLSLRCLVEHLKVDEYSKYKSQMSEHLAKKFDDMLNRVPFDRVPYS